MAQEYTSGFCKNCDEQKKLERKATSHLLHFILTIITAGFWLIPWILVSFKFGGWICSNCGSKKNNKNTIVYVVIILLIIGGTVKLFVMNLDNKLDKEINSSKEFFKEFDKNSDKLEKEAKGIGEKYIKLKERKADLNVIKENPQVENNIKKEINTKYYSAQELNDLAYEYYKKKDYLNAYKYWKETTQKHPKFAMGYYNLACVMNLMLDTPQYNKNWPSIEQKDIVEYLQTSIKYKKNRWKRMQKDKDLKSLYSSFGYQKLLGINLSVKKDIQKVLTRLNWTNGNKKIIFKANITKNIGSFLISENKQEIKGSYKLLNKNKIIFTLNNGKKLLGYLKVENSIIEEDFAWVSITIDNDKFYNYSKSFADYD